MFIKGGGIISKVHDWLPDMIKYEEGNLSEKDEIALFQFLLDTGRIYTLQGHYYRNAQRLLSLGLIKERNLNNDKGAVDTEVNR